MSAAPSLRSTPVWLFLGAALALGTAACDDGPPAAPQKGTTTKAPKTARRAPSGSARVATTAQPSAAATAAPAPMPKPASPQIEKRCAQFAPPWGAGSWTQWGQDNPEKGEEWYGTIGKTMKAADLSVLPKCVHLPYLFAGFSKLETLEPVAKLERVRRLDLRNMPQIKDLSPLTALKELEYLNISGTGVTDLSPLAELPALTEIEARDLKLSDAKDVPKLENLRSIDFLKTPIADVTPLAKAPKLEKILVCTTKVGDLSPLLPVANRITAVDVCATPFRDFKMLAKFPKLKALRLSGLPIEDLSMLAELKDMEELDISMTPIKSLKPLQGMSKLKKLTILKLKTKLPQAEIDALKKAVPGVKIIDGSD